MLDHINGDVTAIYEKYDMLDEKRAVVVTLAAELRRVIGDAGPLGYMPKAGPGASSSVTLVATDRARSISSR